MKTFFFAQTTSFNFVFANSLQNFFAKKSFLMTLECPKVVPFSHQICPKIHSPKIMHSHECMSLCAFLHISVPQNWCVWNLVQTPHIFQKFCSAMKHVATWTLFVMISHFWVMRVISMTQMTKMGHCDPQMTHLCQLNFFVTFQGHTKKVIVTRFSAWSCQFM